MKSNKRKNSEKDFKVAKGIFIFSQFFGCAVGVYLIFSCIMEIIGSYANNQTGWVVLYLILIVIILYLIFHVGKEGIQAIKAKKVSELP